MVDILDGQIEAGNQGTIQEMGDTFIPVAPSEIDGIASVVKEHALVKMKGPADAAVPEAGEIAAPTSRRATYLGAVMPIVVAAGLLAIPQSAKADDDPCAEKNLPGGIEVREGSCLIQLYILPDGDAMLSLTEGKITFNTLNGRADVEAAKNMQVTAGEGKQPTFRFAYKGDVLEISVSDDANIWMRDVEKDGVESMEVIVRTNEGQVITKSYEEFLQDPPSINIIPKGEFSTYTLAPGVQQDTTNQEDSQTTCTFTGQNGQPRNYDSKSLLVSLVSAGALLLLRRRSRVTPKL